MSDIFVSYASADRERVAALVQRLEQLGLSVWWDRDIAHGQNFHRVIEQALDRAKCAIVVWSRESVNSEWVVNEASSARKRDVLVPALIDAVEPPLEFRHLQTADLRADNPRQHTEFDKLARSVREILGTPPRGSLPVPEAAAARSLWQTPLGWVLGAAALLLGVAALLAVLKQLGWIGTAPSAATTPAAEPASSATQAAPTPTASAPTLTAPTQSPPLQQSSVSAQPAPPIPAASSASAPPGERINLLHSENGAQLVAAGHEAWRGIIESKTPTCTNLSLGAFVTIGLRGEQATRFDTLAVFVESESTYNIKTLELLAADNEAGPFKKILDVQVPNFRNMRSPYHEFKFAPLSARYVKLVPTQAVEAGRNWGTVCTLRLYGPEQ